MKKTEIDSVQSINQEYLKMQQMPPGKYRVNAAMELLCKIKTVVIVLNKAKKEVPVEFVTMRKDILNSELGVPISIISERTGSGFYCSSNKTNNTRLKRIRNRLIGKFQDFIEFFE